MADLDEVLAKLTALDARLATIATAEKSRADAEKTRAEAEKARVDADTARWEIEKARAGQQTSLDTALADLESKRIANDKARADAAAARVDTLVGQLGKAVPDLASLSPSTVTFAQGTALRQAEATTLALTRAATTVAVEVQRTLVDERERERDPARRGTDEGHRVFLTSVGQLVPAVSAYRQLVAEATVLDGLAGRAHQAADEARAAVAGAPAPEADGTITGGLTGAPGMRTAVGGAMAGIGGQVAAGVAGELITQVASLFQVDAAATTDARDVRALTVHAAVAHQLLATRVRVTHESVGVPAAGSTLLASLQALAGRAGELARDVALLDGCLAGLADLPKEDPRKAPLTAQVTDAKLAATAVATHLATFVTEASAGGTSSRLSAALTVEALAVDAADGGRAPTVLVVDGGSAETSQLVVTRRVLAPRLQTATSVTLDYFLVRGTEVLAAGRASGDVTFFGRVGRRGARWESLEPLAAARPGRTWPRSTPGNPPPETGR